MFVTSLLVGTALAVLLLGGEGRSMLAMAAPDFLAWATMFEVSAYLDAIVTVTIAASALRMSGTRAWVRAKLAGMPRRAAGRTARARRVRRPRPPANDDAGGGTILLAA